MKTTKEIAELFTQEIERISKGDVRKEVITGLEKCSNALIKLARLEMDFAWKNWEHQKPAVPWLSTRLGKGQSVAVDDESEPEPEPEPKKASTEDEVHISAKHKVIIDQIVDIQKQMKTATPTLKTILTDKIKILQTKLEQPEGED